MCAPRQMAKILKEDFGEICRDLAEVSQLLYKTPNWEAEGCTPRMVMEFCKKRRYGCIVVHNEDVIENIPGDPVLAFTVHENRCYFYTGPARRALAKRARPM